MRNDADLVAVAFPAILALLERGDDIGRRGALACGRPFLAGVVLAAFLSWQALKGPKLIWQSTRSVLWTDIV